MSSEYAQPGLNRRGESRRLFSWSRTQRADAEPQGSAEIVETGPDPLPASEEDSGRFRAGMLSPVAAAEARGGRQARRRAFLVFREGRAGLFDRGLLLAEIACALVVAWLVAQYIYTVYFDTAPRRVTPPGAAGVAGASTAKHTPTPVPTQVLPLLPGPWDELGPTRVATTPTPGPTSTPTIEPSLLLPTRLRIPAMVLDSPVHEVHVNMGKWEVSPMEIGHHEGSGNPGQVGNVVLAGHRDINSALFRQLDQLGPGDEIFVSNSLGEYKYIVTDSYVVSPSHTEVMDPTDDKRVTLITCTPIGIDTQRLIVTAILDDK